MSKHATLTCNHSDIHAAVHCTIITLPFTDWFNPILNQAAIIGLEQ